MAVSLSMAGPAAAAILAAGAYIKARAGLDYDWTMIGGLTKAELNIRQQQKADRLNLYYALEEHAQNRKSANRPFLMYEGRSWTYRETYDTVLKYGTWLKETHSVNKGDIVGMVLLNSPTFIFLWLAIWSIGAKPAFINYNLTAEPLMHSIKACGTRLVLIDEDVRSNFTPEVAEAVNPQGEAANQSQVQIIFLNEDVEQRIESMIGTRQPDSIRSGAQRSEMSLLIFTSGTTGLPKPAILAWQKWWLAGKFFTTWVGMTPQDRYYTCMPLYHTSASLLGFCPALHCGATLVIGRRFSARKYWPEVRLHKATIIQYVGETLRYLLAASPQRDPKTGEDLDKAHDVRLAFGNGLRPDVWDRFKERFGIETIAEFYGSTEGPGALWNLSSNDFNSGAIGRTGALFGLMMKQAGTIVAVDWDTEAPARDPANHNYCIPVKTGQPGEWLYKVDPKDVSAQFQGYYKNNEATQKKILRDVLVKGDAYFRTGDVLRWDKEGRWWFCDRIGDTFRWKSENVSTAEVSEVLGSHPNILEANVFGVQVPHHDGRIGCAAIMFDDSATANAGGVSEKILQEVAQHAKARLPAYAVPGFLRVVSQMVATGNYKQQKTGLRTDGVNPVAAGNDQLFWLRGDAYVPFRADEWRKLNEGGVRL